MEKTVSEIIALWDRVLRELKEKIGDPVAYDSFFATSYVQELQGETLLVVAPSQLAIQISESKFKPLIDEIIHNVFGENYAIRFILKSQIKKSVSKQEDTRPFFADSKLNPKYTFETFVVGQSNRQAYQAALVIARSVGSLYNPLLICGDSGLGKTHLLHAIGNYIKVNNPSLRVLYTTTQEFFDEFVKYVKTVSDTNDDFSAFFKKSVDVFLVDDIQFLVGRAKTEEMFFTVFNALYQSGKQIVITSDQHPSNLAGLSDRLKTRFSSGLPMTIHAPDEITSQNILLSKIEANGLDPEKFSKEALEYLAKKFASSVRELEGALNRLLFYTISIAPTDYISLDVAMDALGSLVDTKNDKNKLSMDKIISTVAAHYNLSTFQLTGKARDAQIALARHIAMYLCREVLDAPYTKIGEAFGGKDHTTVINGVTRIAKEIQSDAETKKAVEAIKAKLE